VATDAIRHLLGLGVVTSGIVSMAHLLLPEFASERMARAPRTRGPILAGLLLASAALRVLVPWLGVEGSPRNWLLTLAGVLGYAAVSWFALAWWSARRSHLRYLRGTARLSSG
jgi:hypothetical protein